MRLHDVRAHDRRGTDWGVRQHQRGDPDPRDIMIRAQQKADVQARQAAIEIMMIWERRRHAWPDDPEAAAAQLAEQNTRGPLQDRVRRELIPMLAERMTPTQ